MKRSHRFITSLLMSVVYLLITFSPLAPLAMHSKRIAHALTGQCSGDCRICGCSAERSAARACCCWQKKVKSAGRGFPHTAAGYCGSPPPASPKKAASSCCPTSEHDEHSARETSPPDSDAKHRDNDESTYISSCPCGSGNHLALWSGGKIQHMPYRFAGESPPLPLENRLSTAVPDRLTSRIGDPPEPPPKLSLAA